MIVDKDKDVLAPITFTMDKTVISEASHLSLYVILFTTTLFNREVSACMYTCIPFVDASYWLFVCDGVRLATKLYLGDL